MIPHNVCPQNIPHHVCPQQKPGLHCNFQALEKALPEAGLEQPLYSEYIPPASEMPNAVHYGYLQLEKFAGDVLSDS